MTRDDLVRTDTVRVASIELVAGEESPWHCHTQVHETIFCLRGEIGGAAPGGREHRRLSVRFHQAATAPGTPILIPVNFLVSIALPEYHKTRTGIHLPSGQKSVANSFRPTAISTIAPNSTC